MNFENEIISIGNDHLILSVHPFGARVVGLLFKSKDGSLVEMVESYEEYEPYQKNRRFSGATIGPFAGRISGGEFPLGAKTYNLERNKGEHTIHSGFKNGLHNVKWKVLFQDESKVCFSVTRSTEEDGFPGTRKFEVIYSLDQGALKIRFTGESDEDTHINMTNHSFFTLDESGNLKDHKFLINADKTTVLSKDLIPTGDLDSLDNSKLDLRVAKKVNPKDFDLNYVLNRDNDIAAEVSSSITGIHMKVKTTQPGLQLFTQEVKYFSLETQHFPDTPNQTSFPSTLIKAGEKYEQSCEYIFSQK